MTIGPDPMTMTDAMSSRRGITVGLRLLHEGVELGEEVAGVVRARSRLGVVLHAVRGRVEHPDTFDDAVVEVAMRDLGDARERVVSDGVVVVLARDLDRVGGEVAHGVVAAVVAERAA